MNIFKLLVFGVVFECQCYFFFHEISFFFQFRCRRLDAQIIEYYFLLFSNLEHFSADVSLWFFFLIFQFHCSVFFFLYQVSCLFVQHKGLVSSFSVSLFSPVEKMYRSQVAHQLLDDWFGANCVSMARRINIYLSLSFHPMERTENKGLLGSTVRCWTIDLDWWLSFLHWQRIHLI